MPLGPNASASPFGANADGMLSTIYFETTAFPPTLSEVAPRHCLIRKHPMNLRCSKHIAVWWFSGLWPAVPTACLRFVNVNYFKLAFQTILIVAMSAGNYSYYQFHFYLSLSQRGPSLFLESGVQNVVELVLKLKLQ